MKYRFRVSGFRVFLGNKFQREEYVIDRIPMTPDEIEQRKLQIEDEYRLTHKWKNIKVEFLGVEQ